MTRRFSKSDQDRAQQGLARLWNEAKSPGPGPKRRFTPREIALAAIDLADRHGLKALTMRRVADHLRVSVMSLYGYVPAKDDLLDLMIDQALGDCRKTERVDSLRSRLAALATANWDLYMRHPWLLEIDDHRPVLGPNVLAKYDSELAVLDGSGLSDIEMQAALSGLLALVRGAAKTKHDALTAVARTGETDQQWWALRAPLLQQITGPDAFPVATRVGSAVGEAVQGPDDPDTAFRFALDRYLDGLVAYLKHIDKENDAGCAETSGQLQVKLAPRHRGR
nr:TetR/AcrR family transcriptional regulator [uncultured Paracoccus sp.]